MSAIGIISDFDDTLKVTNTTNRLKTVLRGLFKKQIYAGMAELYQELLKDQHPLYVVSSSPKIIRRKILKFLKDGKFPTAGLILRDWVKQKNVKAYKFAAIENIILSHPEMKWILVGDDSEWDPEIFASIQEHYPEKISALYIRSIRNRPVPKNVIAFSTAFEIALREYAIGHLSLPQVARIGKAITDTDDFENIIPYFSYHPDSTDVSPHETLSGIQEAIDRRLRLRR